MIDHSLRLHQNSSQIIIKIMCKAKDKVKVAPLSTLIRKDIHPQTVSKEKTTLTQSFQVVRKTTHNSNTTTTIC